MTDPTKSPERWVAAADDGSDVARAGALLRQARQTEPLDDAAFASIRRRLVRTSRNAPALAQAARRRRWQLAVALLVFFAGGALTARATRFWRSVAPKTQPATQSAPIPERQQKPAGHRRALPASPPAPEPAPPVAEAEIVTAPVVSAPPAIPAPRLALRKAPAVDVSGVQVQPPAMAAPPTASALAEESGIMAGALRELRQNRDAPRALAMLDDYDARFGPAAALRREATLARIEALLLEGHYGDALDHLDRLRPADDRTGRALLVARGELRSKAGRCREAIKDFDAVLARGDRAPASDGDVEERALQGRASCRATLGDEAGARADLETYLRRFPAGRFAAGARRAIR